MRTMLRRLRRELRATVGRPAAYQLRDGWGATMVPVLERFIRAERMSDGEFHAAFADDDIADERREPIAKMLAAPLIIPAGKGGKATALVSVRGMALYDIEYQPYAFSTLLLAQTMTALANDPEIGTVVLDVDSPGGVTTGVPEAADATFAARQGDTRVVALINPLAASAAYWIASQASEIVAVPSADVGSIGVFILHADCSKMMEGMGVKPTFIFAGEHKVEGNPFEPLADDARAYWQGEVDTIYGDFVKAVARGRGVPAAKVLADFGQGRTLMAPAAKKAGMVDRVATLNAAMARWGLSQATLQGRRRGEDAQPEPRAEAQPIAFCKNADGEVFALGEWPPQTRVTSDLIGQVGGAVSEANDDGEFTITASNGEAVYRVDGEEHGVYFCTLVSSTYEPAPDPESYQSDDGERRSSTEGGMGGTPESPSEARRRRLALLSRA